MTTGLTSFVIIGAPFIYPARKLPVAIVSSGS